MHTIEPAAIAKRPFDPGTAALGSGFISIGIAVMYLLLTVAAIASSGGETIVKITDAFMKLSFISIGTCLLFLTMYFKQSARTSKVAPISVPIAVCTLILLALTMLLSMINTYSGSTDMLKVVAVFTLFLMIALPLNLLVLALLLKDGPAPSTSRPMALYAALALLPLAFISAVLQLNYTFSFGFSTNVMHAATVFLSLAYLTISAVFSLFILSLVSAVKQSKYSLPARVTGVGTMTVAFIWLVLYLVFTFWGDAPEWIPKAFLIFYALLYFSWGVSLVLITRLKGDLLGIPSAKAPFPQASTAGPQVPGYPTQPDRFGSGPVQPNLYAGPPPHGMPYSQPGVQTPVHYQEDPHGVPYPDYRTPAQEPVVEGRLQRMPEQYGYPQSHRMQPTPKEQHDSMFFTEQLVREYDLDIVMADLKYMNRSMEVSGLVSEVKTTVSRLPCILLQADLSGNSFLRCIFSSEKSFDLDHLNRGNYIHVRGTVGGKSDYVILKNCELLG